MPIPLTSVRAMWSVAADDGTQEAGLYRRQQ